MPNPVYKELQTRITQKIDGITNLTNLVPLKGEIVVGGKITSNVLQPNTDENPYIMKVGDGVNTWGNLPAIGGDEFLGSSVSVSNLGSGVGSISVPISSTNKNYYTCNISANTGIDTLNIAITGTIPFCSEHYLLIRNDSTSDILLNDITAAFGGNVTTKVYKRSGSYITPEDICELQIKIFYSEDKYIVVVVPQLGIMQTMVGDGESNFTWNMNRY